MRNYTYTTVSYRDIRFCFDTGEYKQINKLPFTQQEHIKKCIENKIYYGDLNYYDFHYDRMISGWWEII